MPLAPASFRCPCCDKVMADPVLAADGRTYEHACIAACLQTGTMLSPVDGQPLESLTLFPNVALRDAMDEYWRLQHCVREHRAKRFRCLVAMQQEFSGAVARQERKRRALTELLEASGRRLAPASCGGAVGSLPESAAEEELVSRQAPQAPFSEGAAPRTCSKPTAADLKLRRETIRKGKWWAQAWRQVIGCTSRSEAHSKTGDEGFNRGVVKITHL